MKRLFLLLAISILSTVFISAPYAQSLDETRFLPVTDISTEGTFVPYVWKKFRGDRITLFNFPYMLIAPNIIDWSHAGYKNGNEPIPDGSGLAVYRVADYGGIANDDLSDTQAIRDTIDAVKSVGGNSIILFAPGRYDIYMDDDNKDNFTITGSNIIIRGAGGAGADKGGTTIKMHNHVKSDHHIFKVSWKGNGKNSGDAGLTRIVGEFPKGVKRFQVANGSALSGRKYLEIYGPNLKGADWAKHSSKTASQLPGASGVKTAGITIFEIHEIDHLEGNWVIIKAPTLTHLNSNFQVYWRELTEGLGFEDLHIEGTLNENYEHRVHRGSGGISLKYTAHCWVKRCRFSNVIDSVWFGNCYANTALANITDGLGGHNPLTAITSTYSLFGLYEDRTSNGIVHGVTVANASSGTVFYRIGGPLFGGPDTHGSQPRDTLIDNLYGRYHDGSGGTPASKPSHLDGYVRWNNTSRYHETYDLWQPGKEHGLMITESIIIGWVAPNASGIINATYTESVGTHVYPESLYEAQASKRLGILPTMITEGIEDFKYLFNTSYGTGGGRVERPAHIYDPPQMTPVRNRTPQVRDAIMLHYPGKQHYDEVRPDNLADLNTLDLSDKGITALKSGDFDGLDTLRHLILSGNELTTLPGDIFDGLASVTHVYLDGNEFSTLPKLAFRSLDSIVILYLENNKLTTLSETQFTASFALKNINLSNNEIETIHKNAFAVLPGLIGLNLSGNKLTTLPEGVFEHTPKLKYLNISDNEFTELSTGIFKGLSSLLRLNISGNPTDPLPITVTLRDWQGYLEGYIPVCSPFDFNVKFSIENGAVSNDTLTFSIGRSSSEPTQISRNGDEAVTVDIIDLPSLPKHHIGYELVKDSELPLIILPGFNNAPKAIPNITQVLPNFPNPFNPETWIPYQLAKPADVSITIFNSRGVIVRELLLGIKPAGYYLDRSHAAHWNGRNKTGERVSTGIYFYQFKTDDMSVIQKMVIMK